MDRLMTFIAENPLAALAIGFVLLLVIYFIFKQFIKIFLILLLILLIFGGYQYLKDPQRKPQDIIPAAKDAVNKTIETKNRLQQMYRDAEKFLGKGADLLRKEEWLPKSEEDRKLRQDEKTAEKTKEAPDKKR